MEFRRSSAEIRLSHTVNILNQHAYQEQSDDRPCWKIAAADGSYFAIKPERRSGCQHSRGREKFVAFYTVCLVSGATAGAASWRSVHCRGKIVCRVDDGGCASHPFVVRRPHRYARQCESVRKTGSERAKSGKEEERERERERE